MKINAVIVEAPMGIVGKTGQKILSKIPGTVGAKAQGRLDTGKVANDWKQQYSRYLGRINQKPSTENLSAFLKQLGLDDSIAGEVKEQTVAERELTRAEVDKFLLSAAQKAAGNPSSAAPTTSNTVSPASSSTTSADPTSSKPSVLSRAAGAVKSMFSKKPTVGSQKVEPTVGLPPKSTPSANTGTAKAAPSAGNMDSYVNNWAKAMSAAKSKDQQITLAKEIMGFLKDRQGSPKAIRATQMAKAVLKRSPDPSVRNIAQSKSFAMERRAYSIMSKILEATDLTWKDLGYRVLVTESTEKHVMIAQR